MHSIADSELFLPDIETHAACEVHERLRQQGLVFFQFRIDRQAFVQWFNRLFLIQHHPDSSSDGITEVAATGHEPKHGASSGFTNQALPLHVDGSAERVPPSILCLLLVASAHGGGQTMLSDALDLFHWCVAQPDMQGVLAFSSRAKFREAEYPIFDPLIDPRSLTFRFRQDQYLWPAAGVSVADLRRLAIQLESKALNVTLVPGEGYLLHNHRWTHGRGQFVGPRLAWRLLGSIRSEDSHADLNDGFLIPHLGGEKQ